MTTLLRAGADFLARGIFRVDWRCGSTMFLTLALSISALLSSPVPAPVPAPDGTPVLTVNNLKHGLVAIFKLSGANPGRSCGLFVSLRGAGPTTISSGPCPSLTLSLTPRLFYMGTVNADGAGKATWTKPVPPNAGGMTIWAQGVSYNGCEVSNLLNEVVQ